MDGEHPASQWVSTICPPSSEVIITLDASKVGWCQLWQHFNQRTLVTPGKPCSHKCSGIESGISSNTIIPETSIEHISELRLDNTTAVSYINNQGGTRSPKLMSLTLDLWNWCLRHNIFLKAKYLPGVLNVQADRESRIFFDSSDWRIQPEIIKPFLKDREIDLFATGLTNQLPHYVSWHPDPHAYATNAFTVNWGSIKGYSFPPFNLIPRTLMKVRDDNATLLLVAPIWQEQHWWPLLLQLAISLLFPNLLEDPSNPEAIHLMYPGLQLAVWVISNNVARQKAFRTLLPHCCLPPQGSQQTKHL